MNANRSFLVTLLLAVGAGAVIGLLVFGMTGRNDQATSPPVANETAATPSTSSSSTSSEPMPPVQYDSPDTSNAAPAPPESSSGDERARKVLM